ncbi:MAG: hypothetical protein IJ905_12485 [Fibrobacter sp.]|nr:hypothetical protein [Fibrobacter sp.]
MAIRTYSTKEITLSLFALTETKDLVVTEEIKKALKGKNTVESRIVSLEDGKGKACAMHVSVKDSIVLLHIARYEEGVPIDIIRHASSDLQKDSIEVEVKPPEKDSDYLKCQAVALFCGNAAIVMVSDGREYSLVWNFVHKLLGKAKFVPVQEFSRAIQEAIENHGIKYVRLNGFVQPKSVQKAIRNSDMSQLDFCTSESREENKNGAVKVELKFTPEKNVKEMFSSFLSFGKRGETVFDAEDGIFSVVAETSQGEKIKKDGFCRSKKVKFERYGSFVSKKEAFTELINWFKELNASHEWPSE